MIRPTATLIALTSFIAHSSASAAFVVTTWAAPGSGNWNSAANWNPAVVPNNGGGNTYGAKIDPGGARVTVTLDVSPTIESLSVLGDAILSVPGGRAVVVREGPVDIDYALLLQGSPSELVIGKSLGGSVVSLTGSGQVQMLNDNARIYGVSDSNRLVNESVLIKGRGQIGWGLMRFTNKAEVRADAAGGVLVVDPRDGVDGVVNQGLMLATEGGILRLQGGTFNNAGGTIRSEVGSQVQFNLTASVQSGALRVDPGAAMYVTGSSTANLSSGVVFEHLGYTEIQNNALLDIWTGGTYLNDGVIRLWDDGGGNNGAVLRINGDVSIAGVGAVELYVNGFNFIFGASPADRLTNVGNTIRGRGFLGNNSMRLTNLGTVRANTPSQLLTVDPSDGVGGVINQGTMVASDAGILRLQGGTFNNASGVIRAEPGSRVDLVNATVQGGTLTVQPGATLFVPGGIGGSANGIISGGVFEQFGYVEIGDDQNWPGVMTIESGTAVQNGGLMRLRDDGVNNGTTLLIKGDVALQGGGEIELYSGGNNYIYGLNPNDRLTNLDNTIRGRGYVCSNQMRLTNFGTVKANSPSQYLVVDPSDGPNGVINQGLLVAADGGYLRLQNGAFNNAGGVIRADAGARVELHNAYVAGGTLRVEPGAVLSVPVNTAGYVEIGTNFEQVGTAVIEDNGTLVLIEGATHANSGLIRLQDSGGSTGAILRIDGDVTLQGGGQVELFTNGNNFIVGALNTDRFTNQDNTIYGRGNVGSDFLLITNNGVIDANNVASLIIDPTDLPNGLVNNGTLRASGPGGLIINAAPFANAGIVLAEAGMKITRTGAVTQTAGAIRAFGEVEINSGNLLVQGGDIEGTGLIDTDVSNLGGTISPGPNVATLAIEGALTQGALATLAIELGDSTADRLTVTGAAALNGELQVSVADGAAPLPGTAYTILTAGSRTGEFATIAASCASISVSYTPTSVVLTYNGGGAGASPDVDGDGVVGPTDLASLLGAWGPCSDPCCAADLDGSGSVGAADLAILLGAWG